MTSNSFSIGLITMCRLAFWSAVTLSPLWRGDLSPSNSTTCGPLTGIGRWTRPGWPTSRPALKRRLVGALHKAQLRSTRARLAIVCAGLIIGASERKVQPLARRAAYGRVRRDAVARAVAGQLQRRVRIAVLRRRLPAAQARLVAAAGDDVRHRHRAEPLLSDLPRLQRVETDDVRELCRLCIPRVFRHAVHAAVAFPEV